MYACAQKLCKGGARVASPDFEVGGEEGGRGFGGGVQSTRPTASINCSENSTQLLLLREASYRNSLEGFLALPSVSTIRRENGLRVCPCSSSSGLVFLAEARSFWFRTGVGGLLNGSRRRIRVITTQDTGVPRYCPSHFDFWGKFKVRKDNPYIAPVLPFPSPSWRILQKREITPPPQKWLRYYRYDFRNICR